MARLVDPQKILDDVHSIPSLGSSAVDLLQVTGKEGYGMPEVVKVVKNDSALTADILKVVNSAAFHTREPITAIDHAVSMLGEDMVIGIAMSSAASTLFESKLEGYEGSRGDLWSHDLQCAIASKLVTRYSKVPIHPETAFTCGLLHDLGKAILSKYLKGGSRQIIDSIHSGAYSDYLEAEKQLLGINHSDVGLELARFWKLPEPIPETIQFHHRPICASDEYKPMVYAVHLGDIIAFMSGTGTGTDSMYCKIDPRFTEYFEITTSDFHSLMIEMLDEFQKAKESVFVK